MDQIDADFVEPDAIECLELVTRKKLVESNSEASLSLVYSEGFSPDLARVGSSNYRPEIRQRVSPFYVISKVHQKSVRKVCWSGFFLMKLI